MHGRGLLVGACLVSALSAPSPAWCQTRPASFDIPPQELGMALRAFARAAQSQVAFDAAAVNGRRSKRLRGTMPPEKALRQLLEGSGLTFARPGLDIFIIRPIDGDRPAEHAQPLGQEQPSQIIVTARKREERAIDIPVSVSAASGRAAERRGARNISEFLQEFAGVGTYDRGDGSQKITIRGVSTTLGSNENGYYLDDLPFTGVTVPIAPDVRAWDLDRVEILRGPQGTLFGEGSLGGTVRILTQGADLDRWEAKSDAYLSQTREGGTNRGVKAAFNAPLVPGQFAVRLSGTLEHLPGWIDNDAARTHNINDQTYKTLRVRTRFNPTDRLSINGSYWYYKGDFPAGPANATDTGQQSRSLVQATQSRYEMRGLSAHYDLGLAKAFYGYSHSSFFLPQTGYYLGGSIISDIAIGVTAHEMRLSSSSGDPLQWTVGAYLREARRRDIFQFHQFDIDNVDRTTSWARALFGEATYRLPFAPIDLTAGLRYYRERLEGFEVNSGVPADQGSHVYRSWNPRFSIAWHPRANSILYASAAKGFRAGQLQPTISAQLAGPLGITLPDALRQDYIWTYELGTKVEMADGLLTFEAALYRSHWRNVAVRLPLGNTGYNGLINSPGTRTTGVEASLFLAPARGLTISAGGSWIDASYSGTVPGTGIVEGAPVDDVARFTASAATEYRHGFTERLAAFARLAWQHNSPRDNSAFAIYRPGDAIDRFDLRLGLEVDRLSITLFIDNLTDDRDASSPRIVQPIADGDVDITATRLRPRTVGIELSTYFGRGM